jgi:hypothetical protein
MSEGFTVTCWICGKSVRLEDCKADDRGRPVHEDCYVAITVATQQKAATTGS